MRLILISICLSSLCLCMISCSNTQEDAKESIIGEWTVNRVYSEYGTFTTESGFSDNAHTTEGDNLGTFHFTPDSVNFDYTRNDTLYTGSSSWSLNHERVNSGFVRVDQFRLSIDNYFLFDVGFEDGTSNSEKNAERAIFNQIATNPTNVLISINLEK